jgi:DNA-binding winged helix-turn-helix (wHTH) protein/TolB-like protein/Tfp pilus assembly protein PilF
MDKPPLRRECFEFDGWLADPAACTLVRVDDPSGASVKLEPKTMDVLSMLAARSGEVVAQEELERTVWAGVVVTSQSVYQSIAQLRRALGDEARNSRYIDTVPRRGYRLKVPVRWPAREPAVAAPATSTPDPSRRRTWLLPLLGLAGFALLALATGWYFGRAPAETRPPAIAVLPLRDLGNDVSLGYLAESLAEELTHALGEVAGLRVSARPSAAALAPIGDDPRRVGEALGVTHLLRGSLRRDGERVRVVVTLIDTREGYQAWSHTYERPGSGLAGLPADIARAVAHELQLVLGTAPGIGGSRVATRNPTAYDYYMLGQQRYAERSPFALEEAERYFEQSIEADPEFAAAYAGLANVYIAEYYYADRSLGEVAALMQPLLARALELDPDYGPARAMLGWVALETGDLDAAIRSLTAASRRAPNFARAQLWLGMALSADGQFQRSLAPLHKAVELDPMNFIVHVREGIVLDMLGRRGEAAATAERAVTLAPGHPNPRWLVALLASSRGDLATTIREYERALELAPERSDLRTQLGTLYLDAGRETEARTALAAAVGNARGSESYLLARAWLALLDGRQADLVDLAESLASLDPRNGFVLARAGDLLVLAGRPREALTLYDRSLAALPSGLPFRDLWQLRWGAEASGLLRAAALLATGERARAEAALTRHARMLDRLESEGLDHWGLHYQRACIAALRGDQASAFAELERARQVGWFRTWWAAHDPALAPLRASAAFQPWLAGPAAR